MNAIEKALAEMPKAERNAPATRGELVLMMGKVLEHLKQLKHRNDALEQRIRQLEARL